MRSLVDRNTSGLSNGLLVAVLLGALWIIAIAFYFTQSLAIQDPMYLVAELLPAFAAIVGLIHYRPQRRLPWLILIVSTLFSVAGDAIWWYYDTIDPNNVPYPSVADVFYLIRYGLVIAMFSVVMGSRLRNIAIDRLTEGLIVAVSVTIFCWEYLIEPVAKDAGTSFLVKVVSTSYPALDMLIVAAILPVIFAPGKRSVSLCLMTLGMAVDVATDSAYVVATLHDSYHTGRMINVGWFVSLGLFIAAALHPSMKSIGQPVEAREFTPPIWRKVFLTAASVAPLVVMMVSQANGLPFDAMALSGASVVIFLLAIFRLARMSHQLHRHIQTVRQQNVALERAHNELYASQIQRQRLLHRTVQTGEAERTRIAGDLHDGPIQVLTALSFESEKLSDPTLNFEPGMRDAVAHEIQQRVQGVISELRAVMSGLRPPALEERGMEAAIRDLIAAFRRRNPSVDVEVEFSLSPMRRYHADREVMMYRLVQEGLANIHKHAGARRVSLSVVETAEGVDIVLADDGRGFDHSNVERESVAGHVGMALIKERVLMLSGRCLVESTPGSGTRLKIKIPLSLEEAQLESVA
jgi:signal transduction histidine kinase